MIRFILSHRRRFAILAISAVAAGAAFAGVAGERGMVIVFLSLPWSLLAFQHADPSAACIALSLALPLGPPWPAFALPCHLALAPVGVLGGLALNVTLAAAVLIRSLGWWLRTLSFRHNPSRADTP